VGHRPRFQVLDHILRGSSHAFHPGARVCLQETVDVGFLLLCRWRAGLLRRRRKRLRRLLLYPEAMLTELFAAFSFPGVHVADQRGQETGPVVCIELFDHVGREVAEGGLGVQDG
jgi:hypothetical protein